MTAHPLFATAPMTIPRSLPALPPALRARDGLLLHRQNWPLSEPLGTVVLVHGIAEHSGRYAHVARQLQMWGWQVAAYDQRGHGRSGGPRGVLRREDDLLADVATVIAQVRQEAGCGPLVLMGHSMGGLVAGAHVQRLQAGLAPSHSDVDALVMLSPALDVSGSAPRLLERALPWLAKAVPGLTIQARFDPAGICRDPEVVRAYLDDPLVHDRISVRLGYFIQATGVLVRAAASAWVKPTLLLYAGADRIVQPRGSAHFAQAAAPAVVAHCFADMAHELHNEPDQACMMAHLQRWLGAWHGVYAARVAATVGPHGPGPHHRGNSAAAA